MARLVELDELAVLGVHGAGVVGVLALGVLLQLQPGHRVEELGEVLGHLERLVPVREDVEQVVGRGEVEPREGQPLRLQVLGKGLKGFRQI